MSFWFAIKLGLFFGGILALPVGGLWKHTARLLRLAGWTPIPITGCGSRCSGPA